MLKIDKVAKHTAATTGYLPVVTNRSFDILWINQIIQQFSFGLIFFSSTILISNLTQSNLAIAALFLAIGIPALLVGPIAGVAADTFDRKQIIKYSNAAFCTLVLLLSYKTHSPFSILALVFLISLVNQFFTPAEQSSIPMIITKENLQTANALFVFTYFVAQIGGLTLAGPLALTFDYPLLFKIASLSLFAAYLIVWFLPNLSPAKKALLKIRKPPEIFKNAIKIIFERILEGLNFVAQNPKISQALVNLSIIQASLGALTVLSPQYVKNTLRVAPESISYILIPPAGVGFAGVSWLLGKIGDKLNSQKIAQWGTIIHGITIILISIIPTLLANFEKSQAGIYLLASMGFFIGASAVAIIVPTRTLLQKDVPQELLGRTFSILVIFSVVGSALAIVVASALADFFGVEIVMGITGLLILAIGFLSFKRVS